MLDQWLRGGGDGGAVDGADGGAQSGEAHHPHRPQTQAGVCQVPGCGASTNGGRAFFQRYRICPGHAHQQEVPICGQLQRFCQQHGRFHPLDDFVGAKHSCEDSLAKHKQRRSRRKAAGNGAAPPAPQRRPTAAATTPAAADPAAVTADQLAAAFSWGELGGGCSPPAGGLTAVSSCGSGASAGAGLDSQTLSALQLASGAGGGAPFAAAAQWQSAFGDGATHGSLDLDPAAAAAWQPGSPGAWHHGGPLADCGSGVGLLPAPNSLSSAPSLLAPAPLLPAQAPQLQAAVNLVPAASPPAPAAQIAAALAASAMPCPPVLTGRLVQPASRGSAQAQADSWAAAPASPGTPLQRAAITPAALLPPAAAGVAAHFGGGLGPAWVQPRPALQEPVLESHLIAPLHTRVLRGVPVPAAGQLPTAAASLAAQPTGGPQLMQQQQQAQQQLLAEQLLVARRLAQLQRVQSQWAQQQQLAQQQQSQPHLLHPQPVAAPGLTQALSLPLPSAAAMVAFAEGHGALMAAAPCEPAAAAAHPACRAAASAPPAVQAPAARDAADDAAVTALLAELCGEAAQCLPPLVGGPQAALPPAVDCRQLDADIEGLLGPL